MTRESYILVGSVMERRAKVSFCPGTMYGCIVLLRNDVLKHRSALERSVDASFWLGAMVIG